MKKIFGRLLFFRKFKRYTKKIRLVSLFLVWSLALFLFGRMNGLEEVSPIQGFIPTPTPTFVPTFASILTPTPTSISTPTSTHQPVYRVVSWGGPELWEAVNKKRIEYGVGVLGKNDLLCSIASFRLNQLLVRGSLDNHAGFNELWQNKDSQFYWIFQKYTIWEYMVYVPSGTAAQAVNTWDNTLGHRTLLRGGEYTIGCTYAQNGFGVAVVGY